MASGKPSNDFFAMLPRRSAFVFFAAVFFTFAPLSVLMVSSLAQQRPWTSVLFLWLLSGCIAVSWAATFTLSARYAVGIVLFSALAFVFFGVVRDGPLGVHDVGGSVEGLGSAAAIVVGYVLFVVFISGQGRATMRLQTEMELARSIHETLVPPVDVTEGNYEIRGASRASAEMGGDLIDLVRHDRGTDLIVADISGHGVRAGVVMGMVKAAVRAMLRRPASVGDTMTDLNALLEETTDTNLYATVVVLRLPGDGADGALEYAVAGHHHVLHYRSSDAEPRRIPNDHLPLGLFAQSCSAKTLVLQPGDLLAAYTDGLNETADEAGRELGHEPIEHTIADLAGRPLREIESAVFDLASAHGAQVDDRSLLLVRRR